MGLTVLGRCYNRVIGLCARLVAWDSLRMGMIRYSVHGAGSRGILGGVLGGMGNVGL
jgi:hypothetical protein